MNFRSVFYWTTHLFKFSEVWVLIRDYVYMKGANYRETALDGIKVYISQGLGDFSSFRERNCVKGWDVVVKKHSEVSLT